MLVHHHSNNYFLRLLSLVIGNTVNTEKINPICGFIYQANIRHTPVRSGSGSVYLYTYTGFYGLNFTDFATNFGIVHKVCNAESPVSDFFQTTQSGHYILIVV